MDGPRGCRSELTFWRWFSGGKAAAIAFTLNETAKLNSVNPKAWLHHALGRIAEHKITRIDELLPWRCAARAA